MYHFSPVVSLHVVILLHAAEAAAQKKKETAEQRKTLALEAAESEYQNGILIHFYCCLICRICFAILTDCIITYMCSVLLLLISYACSHCDREATSS